MPPGTKQITQVSEARKERQWLFSAVRRLPRVEGCRKVNTGPTGHKARPTLTSSAHEEVGFGYLHGHTDGDHVSPAFAAPRRGYTKDVLTEKQRHVQLSSWILEGCILHSAFFLEQKRW